MEHIFPVENEIEINSRRIILKHELRAGGRRCRAHMRSVYSMQRIERVTGHCCYR